MRNFKKVMALAVSVAAICSSVSAFAELEYTYTEDLDGIATYTAGTHSLTLNVTGAAGDKTVLVLDNGIADTAATGEDILYINQYTASETAYANMGLKGETALEAGEYLVKFGYEDAEGNFAIKEGAIVAAEKQAETQKVTFYLGDVNGDDATDFKDGSFILASETGGDVIVGDSKIAIGSIVAGSYKLGDVNADGVADFKDGSFILASETGGDVIVGDSTYAIGALVTVEVPAN